MSVTEYVSNKFSYLKDRLCWQFEHNSIVNWLYFPFWWAMRRERGTEFPFYFTEEAAFSLKNLNIAVDYFDNFINYHETERNVDGTENKTFTERLKYVLRNFHYYSNDTMANLYFSTKLPERDYQRAKNFYNHLFASLVLYNTFSGTFLIALNNHFFRGRKTTIPIVALASVTSFAAFALNYKASYCVMDSLFNNYVRRLGHKGLIHSYGGKYPRNVDFIAY